MIERKLGRSEAQYTNPTAMTILTINSTRRRPTKAMELARHVAHTLPYTF